MNLNKEEIDKRVKNGVLNLSHLGLTKLDYIPEGVKTLYCYNNKLNSLPNLPDSLKYLSCSNNNLNSLPNLPDSLKELYCFNNKFNYKTIDNNKSICYTEKDLRKIKNDIKLNNSLIKINKLKK